MYRLYTKVKVDKCHRNRTEVYNALLPCQTLLRNTLYFCESKMHYIRLAIDNQGHFSTTQWI